MPGGEGQAERRQRLQVGKLATLLSALAYPGSGQIVQRRWAAGGFFAVAFSAAFAWFAVNIVRLLTAYYQLAFDFENPQSGKTRVTAVGVLIPFLLSLLLWLAGLVDTVLANRRMLRT
jgi:hypothetical protein